MGNDGIESEIILALHDMKERNCSIKDIATWIRSNGREAKNIQVLKSRIKYHMLDLEGDGIITTTKRDRWITYTLGKNVEILDGTMVTSREGQMKYDDKIGRIMRMESNDGVVMKMLDM